MTRHRGLVAGTAIALLMGAAQLGAAPLASSGQAAGAAAAGTMNAPASQPSFPLLLAQAEGEVIECPEDDPDCDPEEAEEDAVEEETPEPDQEEPADDPEEPADETPLEEELEPAPEEAPETDADIETTDDGAIESEIEPEPAPDAETAEEPVEELPEDVEPEAGEPDAADPAPADEPASEIEPEATDDAVEDDEPLIEDEAIEETAPVEGEAPADEGTTDTPEGEVAEPVDEEALEEEIEELEELREQEELLEEDGAAAEEPSGEEAPLTDSAKEGELAPEGEEGGAAAEAPAEEQAPAPESDAAAQQLDEPFEMLSIQQEEGQRIQTPAADQVLRRDRREGSDVLQQIQNRILIQFNNQIIVESDDRERLNYDATEVYYDELPRGRTRETIVRPNGVQVITIRDRYGDIVRRSRVMPDGTEYVLIYTDDRRWDGEGRRQWRDPALDLPPLRLNIPREQYILDAGRVRDYDAYYEFLELPPVEPVRRLYSVDEVKYSARVRDIARRVDLDTVTFEFGSASIPESEIRALEGLAFAMERLLEENPGETFLIEGHTDAVGSDQANLVLSDRRAEGVAMALTNVFGIPPENLVTQGYGKRYLKINTQEPERQNRRVAVRRITPLVAPVVAAN